MKTLYTLIFSILIFFSGCADKQEYLSTPQETKKEVNLSSEEENFEDEDFSEFEEELEQEEKDDPLEGYNRVMTDFNDNFMVHVMIPVSNGYKSITSEEFRKSIDNFFHNILYPVRVTNNLLQGKFKNSAEESGRFVINSTIGIFGLFDVAKEHFELTAHNEDFGQTLGYWGVKSGPHIVLPFFGPSNLRDTLSMYPDTLSNPLDYQEHRGYNFTSNIGGSAALKVYAKVNNTETVSNYEMMKKDAVDLYPYLKNMYEQYREKQINE